MQDMGALQPVLSPVAIPKDNIIVIIFKIAFLLFLCHLKMNRYLSLA